MSDAAADVLLAGGLERRGSVTAPSARSRACLLRGGCVRASPAGARPSLAAARCADARRRRWHHGAPPGIPPSVAVSAGDGSAVVQWVAPDDDGGATISGYTVTALPGGATASVPGVARTATVTGLTNGVAYRFTVTASNRAGAGSPSAVSDAVTPTAAAGAAGTVLVHEDFATSAGSMEPIAGGAWGVSSGRYVLSAPADGGEGVPNANLAVAGPVVTGDFTLTSLGSTTATDSPFNDFSLIFGFRDPADYWFVSFSESNDPNTSGIFRVAGGVRTELADITRRSSPAPCTRCGSSAGVPRCGCSGRGSRSRR